MIIPTYISTQEVQRVCHELGLRDWTQLKDATVELQEAEIIRQAVGAEALQVSAADFRNGLQVELEHGLSFADANVTNNHPLLTGKIVLAHLKETLDYYTRLEVAELEGDLLKALAAGNYDKLAAKFSKLVDARLALSTSEHAALKR